MAGGQGPLQNFLQRVGNFHIVWKKSRIWNISYRNGYDFHTLPLLHLVPLKSFCMYPGSFCMTYVSQVHPMLQVSLGCPWVGS